MQTPLSKLETLGLQLKKDSRNINYNPNKNHFLKPYIEFNRSWEEKQKKKVKKIKKQNAKLRNNAIFGKPIKNSMNKIDAEILTTGKQYLKW